MNWTLIIEIYVGCIIIMLTVILCFKNKFDKAEQIIMLVLAPLMLIVGIVSIIDQLIKHGPNGRFAAS